MVISGCSIRALWILSSQDSVLFSRRFPVVEKRWRLACEKENKKFSEEEEEGLRHAVRPLLPSDAELAAAVTEKKKREGSLQGLGIRVNHSTQGSDSWNDDPITRQIVKLCINRDEVTEFLLWPLVLHMKGGFSVLILPLIEPQQLQAYERMCRGSECGNSVSNAADSLSSLLFKLPSITGSFMVAHALGDIIAGDLVEPEVVSSSSHLVGGLLDSLTGSIGIPSIAARAKPAAAPVGASTASAASTGSASSDAPKSLSRPIDKDALRMFISGSLPFGTPLDLHAPNIFTIKANGFSSPDIPPSSQKQPAWKPYLYKGKQRLLFTVHEVFHAAMYDRDEVPDSISIAGQINCRAELEGWPEVSLPLTWMNSANVNILSFHPCSQLSEQGLEKQALSFSPPLGNFVLLRYQLQHCSVGPPVKGFYQLSMISEDEGAFLFKLRLMEGYKAPLSMEFCTVILPFLRRRVASFDGTPSSGTVSMTDHSIEWKIVHSGRGITGKTIEATFSGTIKFLPLSSQRISSLPRSNTGSIHLEDNGFEPESSSNVLNIEEYLMEKLNKDLPTVDLEEPLSWQAYTYAKVSYKITGETLSGISIDSKSVKIDPAVKVPIELFAQATAGDYILWNTLGKCPVAATPKDL